MGWNLKMMTANDISTLFLLLILFQIKHFLSDFCFQNQFMLRKSQSGWDFVLPLASHCLVHGLGTLIITLFFRSELWWLALVDFFIHFVMDRFRASPRWLGRFSNTSMSTYWQVMGVDQMVHHLTHYWVVYMIFTQ